jgi:uncharacterized protein (DUF433 family)
MRSASPLIIPPKGGRWLSFANLVEAHTVAAFRATGVSMQRIRPALAYLVRQLEIEHPLASRHLLTNEAELFFRYLRTEHQNELVVLLKVSRGGQVVFDEVVERYLRRVDWAADDYAERLWLAGREEGVAIDPRRGFGQPIIARRGVRVEDVVHRLLAGEPKAVVADDFGLEPAEVEAGRAVQVARPLAGGFMSYVDRSLGRGPSITAPLPRRGPTRRGDLQRPPVALVWGD